MTKRNTELVTANAAASDPGFERGDGAALAGDLPDPRDTLPQAVVPPPSSLEAPAEGPVEAAVPPEPVFKPLEQRIRRLEDALAQLQERRPVAPVAPLARATGVPPTAQLAPPTDPTGSLVLAGAQLLAGAAAPPAARSSLGMLLDFVAEARAIARMFVDPRYKMSWLGRILPLVLLGAFLTSHLWAPGSQLGATVFLVINKVVDLILGYFLFKVLTYEARRYRQTAPDLPPTLRL